MIEIFVLSLVQGITEFLPISSSSHLVIIQKIFNFSISNLLTDISLHIGSFFAVIITKRTIGMVGKTDSVSQEEYDRWSIMLNANNFPLYNLCLAAVRGCYLQNVLYKWMGARVSSYKVYRPIDLLKISRRSAGIKRAKRAVSFGGRVPLFD